MSSSYLFFTWTVLNKAVSFPQQKCNIVIHWYKNPPPPFFFSLQWCKIIFESPLGIWRDNRLIRYQYRPLPTSDNWQGRKNTRAPVNWERTGAGGTRTSTVTYSRTGAGSARTSTVTVALVRDQHCYSRTGARIRTVTVALVQEPALLQSHWCENQHCYSRTGARTSTIAEQYWSLPWDRQAATITLRAALTSARSVQMVMQGKKNKSCGAAEMVNSEPYQHYKAIEQIISQQSTRQKLLIIHHGESSKSTQLNIWYFHNMVT